MKLKLVTLEDTKYAMEIIEMGRNHLKEQGINQWQSGYPNLQTIEEDIEKGRGYFLCDESNKYAYMCIDFCGEPAYDDIVGAWRKDEAYVVIHRLAFHEAARGKKLTIALFELISKLCLDKKVSYMKIDTSAANKKMQHVLDKNNFKYCGIVTFEGGERVAYDKIIG